MIKEYILRAHTDYGMGYLDSVGSLITKELNASVKLIDHRIPTRKEYRMDIGGIIALTPISLDKHLAKFFDVPYFQISRVFDRQGNVTSRIIGDTSFIKKYNYPELFHIIDTDMVNGDTIRLAKKLLGTNSYAVPIRVESHQDLIDMEDLLYHNSYMSTEVGGLEFCNYLNNPAFFSKRTSLPEHLYKPMFEIFQPY